MKHQFRYNPLAIAIFTLLCSGSIQSSYAESNQVVSEVDNKQLKQTIQDSYPGQAFFEQYYVAKPSTPSEKDATEKSLQANNNSSAFCKGAWVTPIGANEESVDPKSATSTITADYAAYDPSGNSELTGNVLLDQQGRFIRANKLTLDQTQTHAFAEGNVQMAQSGLLTQSKEINYNLKTQTGNLIDSFYIAQQENAHGYAKKIDRSAPNIIILNNATYTSCPPEKKPTWEIKAKEITLNQETGRGSTRDARLYVKDVPIVFLPYFNFPIDDRRTTGILNPMFGFSTDGGAELGVPIYLNLAPNYDATITPRFFSQRGILMEGEFRYLTEDYGKGRFWGAVIPDDRKYDNENRRYFNYVHDWNINQYWSTNLEYRYASDKDFISDYDLNADARSDLNLRRGLIVNYHDQIPGLTAQLRVEDYQTLDKNVLDIDRPYARLPQFLLNYVAGDPFGLQFEANSDIGYFKKTIRDAQNYTNQPSGTRLYNQLATRYNFRAPWGYAIPEVSVRAISTYFDQNTLDNLYPEGFSSDNRSKSAVVPQVSLDTGLIFQREGNFLQTLTPRLFYAYSPYKNQTDFPNFDSTAASINYDQLFNPYRFYGHDRLEDNNFVSYGLSYSLLDPNGLERLKTSIGQSYYFSDRRVNLSNIADNIDTENNTGPIVSVSSQLNQYFTISANSAWMANGANAHRDFQLYYTGDQGNLYNIGYYYRKEIADRQTNYDQVVASFIQPVKNNWRIMGHVQYDLVNNVSREYLLGVNYESCCWGVSVYGRSYYNDLYNPNDIDAKVHRGVMIELTLKGLGGTSNRFGKLMQNRVLGYDKINQSWTQR